MMLRSRPSLNEGMLIILLGLIGMIRVMDSFNYAGPVIKDILYALLFIYILIILIGIKVVKDAFK